MSTLSLPFNGRRLTVRVGDQKSVSKGIHIRVPHRQVHQQVAPEKAVSVEPSPQASDTPEETTGAPKGNASRAAWRDYADTLGIKTEGMTRADIRDAVKEANQ